MPGSDRTNKNYYQLLGVDPDASADEIKKEYKKLARAYHPDLNPKRPRSAEDRFKRLQEVYSVLSDPTSRQQYDESIGIFRFQGVMPTSDESPDWTVTLDSEEPRWRSIFRELGWRPKVAIIVWALCLLGSFLPTSSSVVLSGSRFTLLSTAQRLVLISIPLLMVWMGSWLSDDDGLDMSSGTMFKGVLGRVLEIIGWLYFVRLIGFYFLGPLILLVS
jgi:hypothetical protein